MVYIYSGMVMIPLQRATGRGGAWGGPGEDHFSYSSSCHIISFIIIIIIITIYCSMTLYNYMPHTIIILLCDNSKIIIITLIILPSGI